MAVLNARVKRRILKGMRRLGAWALHRLWLHRAGFMPFWTGAGVAAIGAALDPAIVPALAPAAAALLLAGITWFRGERLSAPLQRAWLALIPDSLDDGRRGVLDRPTERGFAALLTLSAGTWWTALLRDGWSDNLWWALGVGVLVFGAPWWWHRGWRRKKPLNRWARRWGRVNSNPDLKPWHGSKVVNASGPAAATMLEVELRRGLYVKHVGGDAMGLCSTLNLRPGAVTVAGASNSARRVLVRVVPSDPWGGALPHPLPAPGSLLVADRPLVDVGRYEDSTTDLYKIAQHAMMVGATGTGKSAWLESLVAHILGFADARLAAADLASGATFGIWEPVLSAPLATGVAEAWDLIRRVFAVIEHRETLLSQRKRAGELIDVLPPSPDLPWLWLIIDEFPDLVAAAQLAQDEDVEAGRQPRKLPVVAMLERLAKKGRKVGVWLVLAAQNPTKNDVGSTELRGQMTAVVGLGLDGQQSKTLWGSASASGWDSTPLTTGTYLLRDRTGAHNTPRVAKGLWVPPDARADLIRAASRRPRTLEPGAQHLLDGGGPTTSPAIGDTARSGVYEVGNQPAQPVGRPTLRLVGPPGVGVGNPPTHPTPLPVTGGLRGRAAALTDRVLDELPNPPGGVGATELADQLDTTRDRVRGALRRLVARGLVAQNADSTWCRRSAD